MPKNFRAATILSGAALSEVIDLHQFSLVSIIMPANWTTAHLTFQASMDGVNNFQNVLNDSGDEYDIPAVASSAIQLNVPLSFPFIKIRSGTTASPVNQSGDKSLGLSLA